MPQSDAPSFHVRLPASLLKRLKITAVENERSMNAEIAARLERSFDLDANDRGKAVALLTDALSILKGSG